MAYQQQKTVRLAARNDYYLLKTGNILILLPDRIRPKDIEQKKKSNTTLGS